MSTKIKLYFKEFPSPELMARGVSIRSIRLFAEIRFKTHDGWTNPYSAILDTGAPACVIPFKIWSRCEVNLLADYTLRGIIPKEECSLPVLVGKLVCVLVDRERESDEFSIRAYLTLTDEVPLMLGFDGLLEETRLCMNYQQKEAFLETI